MSENDDATPEDFASLRTLVKEAKAHAQKLRREYEVARRRVSRLRANLQAICAHADVTECPEHEEFRDGFGFPPTKVGPERRCEGCGLTQSVWKKDAVLFKREVTRTVENHVAFKSAGVQDDIE